ncbi:hypothetical protein INR49_015674, partial [Caranx melampygus]
MKKCVVQEADSCHLRVRQPEKAKRAEEYLAGHAYSCSDVVLQETHIPYHQAARTPQGPSAFINDEALHVYKGHQFCPGSRRMQLSVPCLHGSDAPQSIAASEQTSEQQTVDAEGSTSAHPQCRIEHKHQVQHFPLQTTDYWMKKQHFRHLNMKQQERGGWVDNCSTQKRRRHLPTSSFRPQVGLIDEGKPPLILEDVSQGFLICLSSREALEPELCVVMVSTVVMPSPTLAGAASMLIQKDTQDRMT